MLLVLLALAALAVDGVDVAAGRVSRGAYSIEQAALDPACPPHPPPSGALTNEERQRMQPAFDSIAARMDASVSTTVPSSVLGVFYRGTPLFTRGVGKTSTAASAGAPTVDTQYRIGSVTKVFATLQTLMMAAESHRMPTSGVSVSLDASLDDLIGLKFLNPFAGAGGQPTLRQLASQRSGLPREAPCTGGLLSCDVPDGEMLGRLAATILIHPPGEGRPSYSNLAYSLLGRGLVLGSNTTWEEWVQARILDPLGMQNTTFELDAAAVASGRAAAGYAGGQPVPPYSLGWMSPCGGMVSTVNDLATLGQASAALRTALLGSAAPWTSTPQPAPRAPCGAAAAAAVRAHAPFVLPLFGSNCKLVVAHTCPKLQTASLPTPVAYAEAIGLQRNRRALC